METLTAFIEQTNHIPPRLIRAVVNKVGGWAEFKEKAADIANHGAAGGVGGFIYYAETVPFTKKHKKQIMELARQDAESLGVSLFDMIAGFNGLGIGAAEVAEAIYSAKAEDRIDVFNILAWYALESVAQAYENTK